MRIAPVFALAVVAVTFSGCLGDDGGSSGTPPGRIHDPVCTGVAHGVDLQYDDMATLQAAMAAGHLTAVQLVEAYMARIEALDDPAGDGSGLNSIIEVSPTALEHAARLDAERAAGQVRGPLHGMPILLKDNVGTNDQHTTAGSIALAGNVPPDDATLTARLREAGAIILGKANLSEFANWVTLFDDNGYSSHGGQTRNAYVGDPLGSSTGSGVATSMAFSAGAIGTETSGSILSPAWATGIVGHKPTTGLIPRTGIIPLAQSFDTAGPMTRHVWDAAALLGAVAGTDPADPRSAEADDHLPADGDYTDGLHAQALAGVRVGYEADSDPLFQDALIDLEKAGAVLVPIEGPLLAVASVTELALIFNEFKFGLNRYLAQEAGPGLPVSTLTDIVLYNQDHPEHYPDGQEQLILSDAMPGFGPPALDAAALPVIVQARIVADGIFEDYDVATVVGANGGYINLGAAAGYPTTMVPAGFNGEGRPQGLGFFGPMWSDGELLAYAYAYEQVSQRRVSPEEYGTGVLDEACGADAGTPAAADTATGGRNAPQAIHLIDGSARRVAAT